MLPMTRAAFEAALRRRMHKLSNPTQVHACLFCYLLLIFPFTSWCVTRTIVRYVSVHCWQALRNIYLYFPCFFFFCRDEQKQDKLKKMQKTNHVSRKSWLKWHHMLAWDMRAFTLQLHFFLKSEFCQIIMHLELGFQRKSLDYRSSRIWFLWLIKHGKLSQIIHDPIHMTAAVLADIEHIFTPKLTCLLPPCAVIFSF